MFEQRKVLASAGVEDDDREELPPIPAAGWDELDRDFGGAFDGFTVSSDADPGL